MAYLGVAPAPLTAHDLMGRPPGWCCKSKGDRETGIHTLRTFAVIELAAANVNDYSDTAEGSSVSRETEGCKRSRIAHVVSRMRIAQESSTMRTVATALAREVSSEVSAAPNLSHQKY